ncbi:MAG: membrane protein [Chitinophagaceae bacterium]
MFNKILQEKNSKTTVEKVLFIVVGLLCLTPIISPPIALLLGIVFAQFFNHPFPKQNQKATHLLLQISVVGLGFGINVHSALQASTTGFIFTISTIVGTLLLGFILGKLLKNDTIISYLISGGTAICGGSAIAALTPIIKANEKQTSVALSTIFILNSIALFLFPVVGHLLHLSQAQFGLWSAIAIHDTSSVVGAAAKYGNESLQIATTIKLARALWIIPLALMSTFLFKSSNTKLKIPYFIGYFIIAIFVSTYVPFVASISAYIVIISKAGLTLTLFLIGSGLSKKNLQSVGLKPIIQGIILWLIISILSLVSIIHF